MKFPIMVETLKVNSKPKALFLKTKNQKKNMENGENEKIRKNGAAQNTDEQCFGQLCSMAMA